MFTFRKFTALLFVILFIMNFLHFAGCRYNWFSGYYCSDFVYLVLILLLVFILVSVSMAFLPCSGYHHHQVFCSGKRDAPRCAITFDDGPAGTSTGEVLNLLQQFHVPATFFVIGSRIDGQEELLREISRSGHLIGNHSWKHSPWFDFYPAKHMKQELLATAERIRECIGLSPLLFRPPFGVINPMLSKALSQLPYHTIGWDVRSYDTILTDPARIISKIMRKLRPGSVILLHDRLSYCPAVLEQLLQELTKQKYTVVSLTELLDIKAYE